MLTHGTTLADAARPDHLRRRGDPAVRPGHVLRRLHRNVLLDLHRLAGADGDRAALARPARPRAHGADAGAGGPGTQRRKPQRSGELSRAQVGSVRARGTGHAHSLRTTCRAPSRASRLPRMLIDTHCHLADSGVRLRPRRGAGARMGGGCRPVVVIGESARPPSAPSRWPTASRASVDHRRHPPSRRVALEPRDRGLAPRALAEPAGRGRRRDGPRLPLRSFAPRGATHRPSRRSSRSRREAGKPAVIHAREADDDVAAILRDHPGVPRFSIRSAAARRSCERGWSSATMCRSAEW